MIEDGTELDLTIASGQTSRPGEFDVAGTLTYSSATDQFVSEDLSIPEFEGWHYLRIRMTGIIGRTDVDETFHFVSDNSGGVHMTNDDLVQTQALRSLEITMLETTPEESYQTLQLQAYPGDELKLEQGDALIVEIRAPDSSPTFFVPALLFYEPGNGYTSDLIETSELLPYQALDITLRGNVESMQIFETFRFFAGETEGTRLSD